MTLVDGAGNQTQRSSVVAMQNKQESYSCTNMPALRFRVRLWSSLVYVYVL